MSIEVVKAGAQTSFQDLGRQGFQRWGVPCNGVMDLRAHRLANWLVGNEAQEATLEATLLGPTLRFESAAMVAIAGGNLSPLIDGSPFSMETPVRVAANSVLALGAPRGGLRAYIAVQGGYALREVLGSASTNLRAGYGGADGMALKKGHRIPLKPSGGRPSASAESVARFRLASARVHADAPVRIVAGREFDSFTEESVVALASQTYRILPQSDRMGFRLQGHALLRKAGRDLMSEAVTPGTLQVPPDGQPIVLMADCQTTGGYPRIANVAWVDLPIVAQRSPGAELRFEWIGLHEAQRLAIEQARVFQAMDEELRCRRSI